MSRAVVLRPEAEAELEDGHDYLEQFRPGRGAALAAAIRAGCARIAANPQLGTEVQPGVRRLFVSGTNCTVSSHCLWSTLLGAKRFRRRQW